ncbi:MAG: ParB/RepB/Spo0J family partition protein [Rhodospirillaceae bacterium]|jgi:ParB family transcriptional regulator, chromosome partitioning protein|nr:ParB/RepB/Spo0J family partition protein [Rhodospirillaceae bacterium]MBT5458193.1 ParB/RepB/Spo0J family partition protein [Rhodospirillaceae bacterium]
MADEKPRTRQLGRGLSALLGDDAVEKPQTAVPSGGANMAPVEYLIPSPLQPRRVFAEEDIRSLADSVRERGVLQPILVRPRPGVPGRYEIVAGERRWRAAQAAQLHEVPILVNELGDEAVLEVALVENIQRADLTPIEEAQGYRRLIDEFEHTQESLSRIMGKSRSHVANTLRLLTLPESVQRHVDDGALSAGHARALIGAPEPTALARKIIRAGLNVRQTEALVKKTNSPDRAASAAPPPARNSDTMALERRLSDLLGLKVGIEFRGENAGGKVTVHYRSLEQLDDIIRRLSELPNL